MTITLYLTVAESETQIPSSGVLYCRDVDWPFLPDRNSDIEILYNSEDDEWYAATSISRIWFELDGDVGIQLTTYHLDPPEDVRMTYMRDIVEGVRYARPWWTASDGNLIEILDAGVGGWERYRTRRERRSEHR